MYENATYRALQAAGNLEPSLVSIKGACGARVLRSLKGSSQQAKTNIDRNHDSYRIPVQILGRLELPPSNYFYRLFGQAIAKAFHSHISWARPEGPIIVVTTTFPSSFFRRASSLYWGSGQYTHAGVLTPFWQTR